MKLPSLNYLAQSAGQSFLRFPFSIISAALSVCIGIYLTETRYELINSLPYINMMLCSALGIGLFFCVDVFSDNKGYTRIRKFIFELLAIVILVAIYFSLPDSNSTLNRTLPYIRYSIYSITIHLLVAFIPFLGVGQLNGFWHYNRILFIRILTSFLYSGFLYGGLALALGSLDFLFDIDLHDELFGDLFIVIAGVFNTWFFVSGIPVKFDQLDDIREYPKSIKVFSQFVLLPLLILYLIILYIYATKIVFLWSWPKGIVSYLIACVGVLGILTLLLIHPYGILPGNAWIRKLSRAYYIVLFPLIILLFIAIGMRVTDYGITINRYIIILLGVWLTIVSIYFAIGKTNIKFIPVSLAVIIMIVSFGYWGMFSVSERSQVNRLKTILEQGKILKDGNIQKEIIWRRDTLPVLFASNKEDTNENLLSDSLHNEVMSILDYLDTHHGFSAIRKWYKQDIDSLIRLGINDSLGRFSVDEASHYMKSMGLSYEYKYKSSYNSYFDLSTIDSERKVINVHDYDYLVDFNVSQYVDSPNATDNFTIDNVEYTLAYSMMPEDKLRLITASDTILFDTDEIVKRLLAKHTANEYNSEIPQTEMVLQTNYKTNKMRIEFESISFDSENDSIRVRRLDGKLFIKKLL